MAPRHPVSPHERPTSELQREASRVRIVGGELLVVDLTIQTVDRGVRKGGRGDGAHYGKEIIRRMHIYVFDLWPFWLKTLIVVRLCFSTRPHKQR